jgi:hypothetical protein
VKEIISEREIFLAAAALSLAGVAAAGLWIYRKGPVAWGVLWLLASLALPLWLLFQAMDAWLDVTSVVGMAAPYLVFAVIGAAVGRAAAEAHAWRTRQSAAESIAGVESLTGSLEV